MHVSQGAPAATDLPEQTCNLFVHTLLAALPRNHIMSPTNINTPIALLLRADTSGIFSDQATIYSFNKPVLIVTGPFSQDDVNQYDWALRNPHIGS
jgi:hypothetical protein